MTPQTTALPKKHQRLELDQIIERYWSEETDEDAQLGYLHGATRYVQVSDGTRAFISDRMGIIKFLTQIGSERDVKEANEILRRTARKILARKLVAKINRWQFAHDVFTRNVLDLLHFFAEPKHCDLAGSDLKHIKDFLALCWENVDGPSGLDPAEIEPTIISTGYFELLRNQRFFRAVPALYTALRSMHSNAKAYPISLAWRGWANVRRNSAGELYYVGHTRVVPTMIDRDCVIILRLCGDFDISCADYGETTRQRQLPAALLDLVKKFQSMLGKAM